MRRTCSAHPRNPETPSCVYNEVLYDWNVSIQMKLLRVVPVLTLAVGVAAGQAPAISSVFNAASNVVQGLPNSGIAQGAIFAVQGVNMGPSTLTFAPNPFQSTNLDGTSISVTVGSATTNALMYYTSAGQLAALLPSSTPVGSGSMIVSYQGSASTSFAVSVVQNNVGVFTFSQNGQGVAIATYPDYSLVSAVPGTGALADTCTTSGQACPDTYTGAAHPGDVLTLWATGLGAVTGGDSAGSLGQQITAPVTLWIGGVSVPVSYKGRSGCCVGEDQIQFTMPNTVPTGCAVPIILQIGTQVSNSTVLPIASSGRSCTPQSPALTTAVVQTLTTATEPLTVASFQLGRQISGVNSSGVFYADYGAASFGQYSLTYNIPPISTQNIVLSSFDNQPFGTCTAFPVGTNANPNGLSGNPLLVTALAGADPGSVTITGPEGQLPMTNRGGTPTTYSAILSQLGTYFSAGPYTIAGSGGTGTNPIGKFTTNFTIVSPAPTWGGSDQNRLITAGVTRANGFTINWTSGSANYDVVIGGSSYTDDTGTTGAGFSCLVPSTLGTFTVPPSVLLALPSGPYTEIDFKPVLPSQSFTASGLDVGLLGFQYQTSVFPMFN
jgi:uncharacterized protein (TIGR03437 family)